MVCKRTLTILSAVTIFAVARSGFGADWYVDLHSTAQSPDGKSWETAFRDLKEVSNKVADSDDVHVAPGRYLLTEMVDIEKKVRLLGVLGRALKNGAVPESEQVVLDGRNQVPCLQANNGIELHGITFVNGYRLMHTTGGEQKCGGGAFRCTGNNSPVVISNCVFRRCASGSDDRGTTGIVQGGGVGLYGPAKIYESLFEDCGITNGCSSASPGLKPTDLYGGAVFQYPRKADRIISGNVFRRNFIADPKSGFASANKRGSALFSDGQPMTDNCLFESNYFVTAASDVKAVETIHVEGASHVFSNLVFIGNSAPTHVGFDAGVGSVVTHCSFIGNRTSETGWGCLASSLLHAENKTNVITHCLFLNNFSPSSQNDNSGACIYSHMGNPAGSVGLFVRDCAFIGNASNSGGETCLSVFGQEKSYLFLSNCLFEANFNSTSSTSAAALVHPKNVSNYSIVDCLFRNNVSGANGSGGHILTCEGGAASYPTTHSTIRNCAFLENTAATIVSVATTVTDETLPGVTIENCTIAGNRLSSTSPAVAPLGNAASRVFIYNTAISHNLNGTKGYNLGSQWENHVLTSYIGPQEAARAIFGKDGNVIVDNPLFVDSAKGNYRLTQKSPLVNAGQMRDWIQTGQRALSKSQLDLSGLTAVYDATGALPGCSVTHADPCRRLDGALPDIGAYEFQTKLGFIATFKFLDL